MSTQKEQLIKQIEETKRQLTKLESELKKNEEFYYRTIKTFEDACKRLGIDGKIEIKCGDEATEKRLIAIFQLEKIFEAINNGWEPDWNNSNERKYYPWFTMSSVSFDGSYDNYWYSGSVAGSRLCTYSSEVSDYIGKTFVDIYKVALSY